MHRVLFVAVAIACFAQGEANNYADCGSKLAKIENVDISGCAKDANECVLKRNSNVSIEVEFTTSENIDSINTVVHGVMMDIPVPFPLSQPDACKDCGLVCPLEANKKYHYKAVLPVLKSYPKVKVDVKWELQNKNNQDLICILIPARIH